MRVRSVITIAALLLVLIVVVAFSLRKWVFPPRSVSPQSSAPATSAQSTTGAPSTTGSAPAHSEPTATALPQVDPAAPTGIEGLLLQLAQPLLFDVATVRGLAASNAALYVASADDVRGVGMLFQADRESCGVVQTRAIALDGRYRVGGLHLGSAGLWVPVAGVGADTGSTLALLDLSFLDVLSSFQVDMRVRAVAQTAPDELVGVNEEGDRLYAWNLKGRELRSAACRTGARYHDLAVARGSIVAAGVLDEGGYAVIDVLDPASLSLLTRHRAYTRADARWVTAGGFDLVGERLYLLPTGGERPTVLSYVLEGTTLERFVPAVQR